MGKSRLRSEMSNKISPFLRGFGQRPQSRNPSPKSKKMSISTALDPMTTSNLVLAAVEVDERRIGRPKGRRFLYAFLQSPSEGGDGSPATNSSPGSTIQGTMGGSSSSSALLLNADSPMNSNVRMCTLRSYKEWTAEMPKFDQIEKPCNYK